MVALQEDTNTQSLGVFLKSTVDDVRNTLEAARIKALAMFGSNGVAELNASIEIIAKAARSQQNLAHEVFDVASLQGEPPDREWLIPKLIPKGEPTLLNGDGGVGKSQLMYQLLVSTCLGSMWLGFQVARGSVLIYSTEETKHEVHRRLSASVKSQGRTLQDLKNCRVICARGADAVLLVEHRGVVTPTPAFEALERHISEVKPVLVVIDTVANVFVGDENSRSFVSQVLGFVNRLEKTCGSTVMCLQHISRRGKSSGEGDSGSTGWNNHFRSRLYLEKTKEGQLLLREMKQNYAEYEHGRIVVTGRWEDNVIKACAPMTAPVGPTPSGCEKDFRELFDLHFTRGGGRLSAAPKAQNRAPKVLGEKPEAKERGLAKERLERAMNYLIATKEFEVVDEGCPSRPLPALRRSSLAVL